MKLKKTASFGNHDFRCWQFLVGIGKNPGFLDEKTGLRFGFQIKWLGFSMEHGMVSSAICWHQSFLQSVPYPDPIL
jgi:hypothetical protein